LRAGAESYGITPSIDRVLRGLGVDHAQGYGVSQPQKLQRVASA
jgi:hypothetical protein